MGNQLTRINVLSASPIPHDHDVLTEMMRPHKWAFYKASTLCHALRRLRALEFKLVICERDVPWKDLLAEVLALPKPPFFIVTSLHADDGLWAEALNLGAYDVLAKPFQSEEVRRSVAAIRWALQSNPAKPFLTKTAGG